ncbi:hypothetical protein A7D27_06400 [Pseudomonas sp. 1D4]|nr:hypothetical protein A7D27_06400 [Pseudomonas sp. 1D4]
MADSFIVVWRFSFTVACLLLNVSFIFQFLLYGLFVIFYGAYCIFIRCVDGMVFVRMLVLLQHLNDQILKLQW